MADLNIMPWFTDAYLADTTHLKTIEHGAYDLLLLSMWRAGGSLPNEETLLQRITKLTPGEWKKVWPVVSKFFTIDGGRITQKKLSSTYANVSARVEKNRANGRLGGRPPKPLENNDEHKANGSSSVSPKKTETVPDGTLSKTVSVAETDSIPPVVPPSGGNPPQQTAKPVRGKRDRVNGTRLSPEWNPTQEDLAYARSKGLSDKAIEDQAERFRNHWVSSSKSNAVKLNWHATFCNWILSSIERNPALITQNVTGVGEVSQELKERGWRIYLEREATGKQLPNGIRKEDIPQEFVDRWNAENGGLFGKVKS
jgi:uncharacterized protein YdaU (DUF1376 family)